MVDRYVEDKIRAALEKSGGSRMGAMKLIAKAAQSDERLLRGLAQPHFQGLVAYATDRVMRKHDIKPVPEPEEGAHQGRGQRVQGKQQDLDGEAMEKILNRLRQRAHQNAREEPDQKPANGGGSGGVSQEQGLAAVVADAKRQQGAGGGQATGRQHVSAVRSLAKSQRGPGR